ncbi:glycosyltransferase [Patescibacteria group bacterium]|nr:glycosyltransferase [Patescibacteria group bacterium]
MTSNINSSTKLSILLPVRNEGINVEMMLKILTAVLDISNEILVIFDFAQDDTIPVIKKLQPKFRNIRLVHNKFGKGVPNAIKAGVEASKGEYILIFAVDDAGPALAIGDMVKLMDDGCDLVSCTRYAYGGRRLGGSFVEGILSRIANRLFSYLSGSYLTDSTTGFKMFKKSILDKIDLESKPRGWAVVFELAVKAQAAGMKLGEVPIISIDRLYGGKSTFALGPWFGEYLRWFLWGVLNLHNLKTKKKLVRVPDSTAF